MHDTRVGHILHIEVKRVEEQASRGVAHTEHPPVQHLPCGLLFDEGLGPDVLVLEVDFAILEGKFADLQPCDHFCFCCSGFVLSTCV